MFNEKCIMCRNWLSSMCVLEFENAITPSGRMWAEECLENFIKGKNEGVLPVVAECSDFEDFRAG